MNKNHKVKDVMTTDTITAAVPGNREDVLRLFGKHEITGMPVVKAGTSTLAGIITRSDLFRHNEEEQLALIMNDSPLTIAPDATIEEAATIFFHRRVHGLPVVDDGELQGIIAPSDILRLIKTFDGEPVEDHLSPLFIPIYQETPLPAVMRIFKITDVDAVPVIDGEGALAGIVGDGDLFTFSHLQESVGESEMGIGEDEDMWSWEGIRDVMRLYYETSKIELPPIAVKEVMVTELFTVFRKTPISRVAEKMLMHDVNQLPVTDENDELMGMVSDIDLMKALIS
ncbi:MAG: CBS domain-containing protein [Candidatus Thermoplasmatota archaeon]|nr:CBS domain-containing protein [Candidatus Thermoplasmatota archaeon]